MAGLWLHVDHETPDKSEITQISILTGKSRGDVFLLIFKLWRWVNVHWDAGTSPGITPEIIADIVGGDAAFWRAVEKAGWLEFTPEGATIPGWDVRLSPEALSKENNAERQRRHRFRNGNRNADSNADRNGKGNTRNVTKNNAPNPYPDPNTKEDPNTEKEDSSEPPSASEPAVLTFDCVGKGPREFALTQAMLSDWQGSYPTLDVLAEFRKARRWLISNPNRKKTATGMPKFLTNWLNRATNSVVGENFSGGKSTRPTAEEMFGSENGP